jgi:zinc transporter
MRELPNEFDYIISAYSFDGRGGGKRLSGADVAASVEAEELAWVHMDARAPETRQWLKENVSYLDESILDALLAEETRPRVTEFRDGALVILRGVNVNENAEPEDMISIRLWIDPHRIISSRIRQLNAVQDVAERLEAGNGPRDAAEFLVTLSTRLFERMEPVILELNERMDNVEEALLEGADAKLRREIIDIRKKAIILRRYIAPQKDVMWYMRNCELNWIASLHRRQLHENYERMLRYVEDLDAVRERAQVVKDELAAMLADRMNRNMYTLSIVAAVFLPLGFLTGLLGINVGGIPGVANDYAFWIVAAICAAFIVTVGGVFKLIKWL